MSTPARARHTPGTRPRILNTPRAVSALLAFAEAQPLPGDPLTDEQIARIAAHPGFPVLMAAVLTEPTDHDTPCDEAIADSGQRLNALGQAANGATIRERG